MYSRIYNFKIHPDFSNVKQYVKVEIHSLSFNLYFYLRSLELALIEDGYLEPVKVFSNINNGYGIVGIYNVNEKVLEID